MLDLMGTMNGNDNNPHQEQPQQDPLQQQQAAAMANTEATPLLLAPSHASGDSAVGGGSSGNNHQYYFLNKQGGDYQGGTSASVRDEDGGEVVEEIPEGSVADEFAPKQLVPIGSPSNASSSRKKAASRASNGRASSGTGRGGGGGVVAGGGGFWSNLFGGMGGRPAMQQHQQRPSHPHIGGNDVGTLVKPRKAPIKVEPKVFFANERTFLAWMHLSVTLAGASIAILAFAEDQNPFSQLYGVLLLPVAIAFILYSMYQYQRRAVMIRRRNPGPYDDTVGPAVLGIMLMVSIVAQFALKLYSMSGY